MVAELKNFTPFANMQFANLDNKGREFGVFMVKSSWDILEDGTCVLSEEQEPFALTDEFHGELNQSSVYYPSDIVPYKPTTDFILNATAFAPGNEPSGQWDICVQIEDDQSRQMLVDRTLRITGPREWQRRLLKWGLDEPELIDHLDVRYEHAYGGFIHKGKDEDENPIIEVCEFNPVGKGYSDRNWLEKDQKIPAPQILFPHQVLSSPFEQLEPAGLGPTQASWLPRRPLGGTYDEHWTEHVWPNWPDDYDFSFHNAAPEGMRSDLAFGSGVNVRLSNLHPTKAKWDISVPNPKLVALTVQGSEVIQYGLQTDSIFLDIAHDRLSDPRVFIMSRMVFDREITEGIILTRLNEPGDPTKLKSPPKPEQVAKFIAEDEAEVPA